MECDEREKVLGLVKKERRRGSVETKEIRMRRLFGKGEHFMKMWGEGERLNREKSGFLFFFFFCCFFKKMIFRVFFFIILDR